MEALPLASLQSISKTLPCPGPNDWLAQNPENGQTLAQYLEAVSKRPKPEPSVLYLYPYFDSTPFSEYLLRLAKRFLSEYFSLSVHIRDRIPESILSKCSEFKHDIGFGRRASSKMLPFAMRPRRSCPSPAHVPVDGVSHVLLTDYDLWYEHDDPDDWLFGLAEEHDGRAVVSTARLLRATSADGLGIARFLKILSHEIGHTLHFAHCTAALCNMNGKNNLSEVDRHPIELCPSCLQKLYLFAQFAPHLRVTRLIATLTDIGVDLADDYFYSERAVLATVS